MQYRVHVYRHPFYWFYKWSWTVEETGRAPFRGGSARTIEKAHQEAETAIAERKRIQGLPSYEEIWDR